MSGLQSGTLGIFDLQKHQTLKFIQIMRVDITSVTSLRDNQRAFITDWYGNIKMIKWQTDANSRDEFDFTEELKKVGSNSTVSTCLTKDEKYLLVGSFQLVSVFETTTREVTKEFKLTTNVKTISLVKDGKRAIIAEYNGDLSILDLETMEISSIAKNITKHRGLSNIIVI